MNAGLTLSDPVRNEVSGTYKQFVKLYGKRLLIEVKNIERESGLTFRNNGNIPSVLVPLDDASKSALSLVESFVQRNVESERYKPLWLNDFTFCNISSWCQYVEENSEGIVRALQPAPDFSNFGRGTYSLIIHASSI